MKTVYIPKGETVTYDTLITDRLVVKGCLRVNGFLRAKSITGSGMVIANRVSADDICVDDLEVNTTVACTRLMAKRVHTGELFASESAAVSCFLSADYADAGKLTTTASKISEVRAKETINLTPKRRSMFRLLLASALRSLWLSLTLSASARKAIEEDDGDIPFMGWEAEEPPRARL